MLASSLLVKKRHGEELTNEEIEFLINGFCSGEVADYQMSAFAMAVCVQGMGLRETMTLTRAMQRSGEQMPRSPSQSGAGDEAVLRLDKHSTGGLGDKVSLILAPLLASIGFRVPMISGRGLGHTGGTLDKLESIEGFHTSLTPRQSLAVLDQAGAFIVGASQEIAPADRKLYALRDVTGTVDSIPLITASILSKKLAANLDALVIDVKTGAGTFMKTESEATQLAESLVHVGCQAGLPTTAILSDMDQPLGETIGNAIEVNESIDVLRGRQGVTRELTLQLCLELLRSIEVDHSQSKAREALETALDSGAAMESFERMVTAQGGRLDSPLEIAPKHVIESAIDGSIFSFDCKTIGETIVALGGGRRKQCDSIDPSIGIRIHGRIGDSVKKGQPILTLHCHRQQAVDYLETLRSAVQLSDAPVPARPLILKRLVPSSETQDRIEATTSPSSQATPCEEKPHDPNRQP